CRREGAASCRPAGPAPGRVPRSPDIRAQLYLTADGQMPQPHLVVDNRRLMPVVRIPALPEVVANRIAQIAPVPVLRLDPRQGVGEGTDELAAKAGAAQRVAPRLSLARVVVVVGMQAPRLRTGREPGEHVGPADDV